MDEQIQLLIDAAALGDDSAYRGIGTYVRRLLTGLTSRGGLVVTALAPPKVALPAGVRHVPVRRIVPRRWQRAERELLLPFALRNSHADVFHSPALDPPRRYRGAWVQTLHDVIPLVLDDPDLEDERRRWSRHAGRYRSANAVIAVSRHTADVGISALGLDAGRVKVIPHGVGREFKPPQARSEAESPYLLSVGEYSRRKGYPEAFEVVGALAELGYPHRLRVSGRLAPWVRPAVEKVVNAAPSPDRIELIGFVDDLVGQYQHASLLLVTSRYEGFGLPILEAMACGTPVVAFANSAISEVVGDAGVLVADGDIAQMVSAVRRVLDESPWWEELSQRGLDRAKRFTWERTAAAHVEVYRSLRRPS